MLDWAIDLGVNFIDTADVYSGGLNEKAVCFRWILMHYAVSCLIIGASGASQAEPNAKPSELLHLSGEDMDKVREIYEKYIKPQVHHLW